MPLFIWFHQGGRMLKHQEVLVELADRGVIYGIDENKVKLILQKAF